ncbi:acyl-coenzyme A thioesterase THEM5 isoform X2 [Phascolarctos cinereus]|uniref:Acyl-coenzyme A thioesterase THEM5 isoform X2 n=1 Tax=Phascolarctos cinereus TaxID=38626 RepID=A0A6P5LDC6_PHACI|nr:acyl-coenzyme A thioesterase THEM5 isoform X2 [Phascolarctos cinereus]
MITLATLADKNSESPLQSLFAEGLSDSKPADKHTCVRIMMPRSLWLVPRFGSYRGPLRTPSLRPQSVLHRHTPKLVLQTSFSSSTDSLISRFFPKNTNLKDYALPNASWSPDMMRLYKEFLEKTKDGDWIRLPSFKSNSDHIRGLKMPSEFKDKSDKEDYRIFTRCIEKEGQGYEYVIFFHPSKKKSVCLFQPGPYLEGPPSIIPMNSVVLLKVEVEKIEDQKVFLSCIAHSPDQQVLFAKASGVFFQLELEEDNNSSQS